MRCGYQALRRVVLTSKPTIGLAIVVALVIGLTVGFRAPAIGADTVDDYPRYLRTASQNSLVDPWSFYNRECTSFVAWRLNNNAGIAFHNYYGGEHWGNASNWAYAAQQVGLTVDDVPTRGAVAWWRAGSPGSSRGHVAWVASVSASSITIEEYNYLTTGGYDTRVITSSSNMWPTSFIHLRKTALRNTARPEIKGEPTVGDTLAANRGLWSEPGAEFSYQWYADDVAIEGKTRKTLHVTAALRGARLQVEVEATKGGTESATARSAKTRRTAPGEFVNSSPPVITGTAQVGRQLSANPGQWTPRGQAAYQWFVGGQPIEGAESPTFTPTAAQLDRPIKVRVRVTRDGYRPGAAVSAQTAAVLPGTFVTDAPPTIAGVPQVGAPLTASPGSWSPNARYGYQWYADGTILPKAKGTTYTPKAAQLRQKITVEVTAKLAGYTTKTVSSAPTAKVAPGGFLNTRPPSISGKPQVGVELTADPGEWSPKARFGYQWFANGDPIHGATEATFTPRAAELGTTISVQVTAKRRAYLTVIVEADTARAVAPGVIENLEQPVVSGRLRVHSELTASTGSWSVTPTGVSYQWFVDGKAVDGATDKTYTPTRADAGLPIRVRVTVERDGYTPASRLSKSVAVLLGDAAFAGTPRVSGRATVGQVLTVHTGKFTPRYADVSYQWYRGTELVEGATRATYRLHADDLHRRMFVVVTLTAPNWAPATIRSEKTDRVTQP